MNNAWRFVEKKHIKTIRNSLIELKQYYGYMFKFGLVGSGDKNKISDDRKKVERMISKIDNVLIELKKDKSISNIPSDYTRFQIDELNQIEHYMREIKKMYTDRIDNGLCSDKHEEDITRREIHRVNVILSDIEKSNIKRNKLKMIREHVGETSVAADGKTIITLVYWVNDNNISVKFPDGRVLSHRTYRQFVKGKIKRPRKWDTELAEVSR